MAAVKAASASRADRVFQLSLLLLALSGYLAIFAAGELEGMFAVLALGAVAARVAQQVGGRRLPIPKVAGSALVLGYFAFYAVEVFYLSPNPAAAFLPATIRLVVFLSAWKLITGSRGRDYFYLGFFAFLQILTAALFLPGPGYLLLLTVFLLLLTVAYMAYEIKRGCESGSRVVEDFQPARRRRLGYRLGVTAAAASGGTVILSLVIFLVLPRMPGQSPRPGQVDETTIGFATEVNLGATGSLHPSYTPVMRVEPLAGGSVAGLLWRGLTLRHFDGKRWSNPPRQSDPVNSAVKRHALSGKWHRPKKGRRIRYRVTPEPLPTNALFLAGLPEVISSTRELLRTDDDAFLAVEDSSQPLRYEVRSWIPKAGSSQAANVVELFSDEFKQNYLQLPKLDPRIKKLARRITKEEDQLVRAGQALESYFRTEFQYSLERPSEPQADPLIPFLFKRREGHCEYFASAMAVMLRTLGIPSRVATGFAGGVYNPISGLHVIRSSDAHAWVEAYIPQYGWISFDPTPSAPARLASGWLRQYWLYWDAMQSAWAEWVVGYNAGRQKDLARSFHSHSYETVSWVTSGVGRIKQWFHRLLQGGRDPGQGLAIAAALALVGGLLVAGRSVLPLLALAYRKHRLASGTVHISDSSFFYQQALRALQRRGLSRQPWQTAEELAASVREPELHLLFAEITSSYNAARFGGDSEALRRLPTLVQALERS